MTDDEYGVALIAAAFGLAARDGWRHVTGAAAARHGGLDLARARGFAGRGGILRRFGQLADAHALTGALAEGPVKDRLFDILLRRIDFLQMHRPGVLALLRALPLDPALAAWLAKETVCSMGWMLEATGVSATGARGEIRKKGLAAVWAWGVRTWAGDESEDLSATMAAFDVALARAEQIAAQFLNNTTAAKTVAEASEPEPELPLEMPS